MMMTLDDPSALWFSLLPLPIPFLPASWPSDPIARLDGGPPGKVPLTCPVSHVPVFRGPGATGTGGGRRGALEEQEESRSQRGALDKHFPPGASAYPAP